MALSSLAVVLEVYDDNVGTDKLIGTCGKIPLQGVSGLLPPTLLVLLIKPVSRLIALSESRVCSGSGFVIGQFAAAVLSGTGTAL